MNFLKAMAATVVGVIVGGCFGFVFARVLVEGFDVVDGPPAVVLLVLSVIGFAVVLGVGCLVFWLRLVRKRAAAQSCQ